MAPEGWARTPGAGGTGDYGVTCAHEARKPVSPKRTPSLALQGKLPGNLHKQHKSMMGFLYSTVMGNVSDSRHALVKGAVWTHLLNLSFLRSPGPASREAPQWRRPGRQKGKAAHSCSRDSGGWKGRPLLYCPHQMRLPSSETWDRSEHKHGTQGYGTEPRKHGLYSLGLLLMGAHSRMKYLCTCSH